MTDIIMHGCNGHMGQVISGIVKEDKYEKGDPKWITHMIRYSPLRSMYLYEHPYEAYKSFEFGIKTRK